MIEPRVRPSPAYTPHQLYQKKRTFFFRSCELFVDRDLQTPTPEDVKNLTGAESLFSSDEYLIPVIEDDPLLRAYVSTHPYYDAQ